MTANTYDLGATISGNLTGYVGTRHFNVSLNGQLTCAQLEAMFNAVVNADKVTATLPDQPPPLPRARNIVGAASFTLVVTPGENITAKLISASQANTLVLIPAGSYLIDDLNFTANNAHWRGLTSGVTLTSTSKNPIRHRAGNTRSFTKINFVSTNAVATPGYYGLMWSQNEVIDGIDYTDCRFSAPSANTNGCKWIADTAGSSVSNINHYGTGFDSIGAMGSEMQHHNYDGATRWFDHGFYGCSFRNLGLVSGVDPTNQITYHEGMGVSMSGRGSGLNVDQNTFDNCYRICIEITGGVAPGTAKIRHNRFRNITRFYTEGNYATSLISLASGVNNNGFYNTGQIVTDNIAENSCTQGQAFFENVNQSLIARNRLKVVSFVTMVNCSGNTCPDNTIISNGFFGLFIEHAVGKISYNNAFSGLDIDMTGAATIYDAVRCNNTGTTGNTFAGTTARLPAGQTNAFGESNNATGNTSTGGTTTNAANTTSLPVMGSAYVWDDMDCSAGGGVVTPAFTFQYFQALPQPAGVTKYYRVDATITTAGITGWSINTVRYKYIATPDVQTPTQLGVFVSANPNSLLVANTDAAPTAAPAGTSWTAYTGGGGGGGGGTSASLDELLGPAPTLTGEIVEGFSDASGRLAPSLETQPNGKLKVRNGNTLPAPPGYFYVFLLNSGPFVLDLNNDSQNQQEFDRASNIEVQLRILQNGTPQAQWDNQIFFWNGLSYHVALTKF